MLCDCRDGGADGAVTLGPELCTRRVVDEEAVDCLGTCVIAAAVVVVELGIWDVVGVGAIRWYCCCLGNLGCCA